MANVVIAMYRFRPSRYNKKKNIIMFADKCFSVYTMTYYPVYSTEVQLRVLIDC